ncbi:MAG: hypothetical protein IJY22_05125 [Clostridia bacterium]|nr:hypothetical protein [Clostridia bacterium]
MKKFARILALMLVATMLCVMLVACAAKPAEDPNDAKAALEENDYKVMHYEGLLLETISSSIGDGVTDVVMGTKGDDDMVLIVYFEDEEDAEKYYEKLDEERTEEQKEIDEMEDGEEKDELQEEFDKAVLGHSGKMVWAGTKDAVKAAK